MHRSRSTSSAQGAVAELTDEQREEILWLLSAFFIGEERVTTQFSGLVMAYEDEQEEAFLTTQQVDEARHMQFFDRWFREVAGIDGGITDRLTASRSDVTDAFVELFDERLVKMGERLIADPSDLDAKVDFVTTYHMVIEGTLALTGQHFMLDYYENNDSAGSRGLGTSPETQTAWATHLLPAAEVAEERPDARAETRNEMLPLAPGVLVPRVRARRMYSSSLTSRSRAIRVQRAHRRSR